jgi:hypothetical protein
MRDHPDRELALECLRLACAGPDAIPSEIVARAEAYYAFVADDDSKDKLAAVLKAVS